MKKLTSKKFLTTFLSIVLTGVFIAGCSSNQNSTSSQEKDSSSIKIGVSMKDNSDEFVKRISNAMDKKAKELGVKLMMNDAGGDVNRQISDVETMIAQGVDALIVNPQDIEGSSPTVKMANEANIPIIIVNGDIADENYTGFVGSTDQESGEMLGKWFMENLPKGSNVCILEGPMGQSGQVGRMNGFKEIGMLEYFNVLDIQTANWKRDQAMTQAEDWITKFNDKLDAIICENDDMGMGALSAAKATGRDDIIIGGVDGIDDALEAVKDGFYGISVVQDAVGQGEAAVEVAFKAAKGEQIEYDTRIPFQVCTIENVDEYLK